MCLMRLLFQIPSVLYVGMCFIDELICTIVDTVPI